MLFTIEGLARDVLVEFDVPVGDVGYDFGRHFRHLLAFFALEAVGHEPFAHKFFRELLLRFAFLETFRVTVGIEIAAGVGRVNLVHEIDLAVVLSEFILGVHENQTAFGSHFRAAFEERQRVAFQHFVFFGRGQSAFENLGFRNVCVVFADFSFCGGRDDRCGELLVLAHAVGERNAADFAGAGLISAPSAAAKITANDHFDGEAFAGHADGHHRVGSGFLPVRANVRRRVEKLCRDLVEHLSFEGNALRQHDVEG